MSSKCPYHDLCGPAAGRCGFENRQTQGPALWDNCKRYRALLALDREAVDSVLAAREAGEPEADVAYIKGRYLARMREIARGEWIVDQGLADNGEITVAIPAA